MFEATLAILTTPGSNLKDDAGGANWLFLLPDLAIGHALCLGWPPVDALEMLAHFAETVTVLLPYPQTMAAMKAFDKQKSAPNIQLVVPQRWDAYPIAGQSVDLVFIADSKKLANTRKNAGLKTELQRIMAPSGLLYVELNGLSGRLFANRVLEDLARGFKQHCLLWVTPHNGDIDTAVPAQDEATIRYFTERRLYSPSVNIPAIKRLKRRLNLGNAGNEAPKESPSDRQDAPSPPARMAGRRLVNSLQKTERLLLKHDLGRRYAALVGAADRPLLERPPHYIRAIASQHGLTLDNYRWGVLAGGRYTSRKITFFLFAPQQQEQPAYVVKMVRHPDLNPRLENEALALRLLMQSNFERTHIFPQIVFSGKHHDLAIVGESAVPGVPFRQRSAPTADCPFTRAAVEWLSDLAAGTAGSAGQPSGQIADELISLLARFIDLYQPPLETTDFLASQIATIDNHAGKMPTVFQHGDPGPWNILVTPENRIAFLDWESAEPAGMPLWDLFYFFRSLAISIGRSRGIPDRLESFNQKFLEASPFAERVIESIRHYRRQIDLSQALVEPLFYTCWMHRALKEAARLQPAQLQHGHYVRLLQLSIEHRNSWTLNRLFEPDQARSIALPGAQQAVKREEGS